MTADIDLLSQISHGLLVSVRFGLQCLDFFTLLDHFLVEHGDLLLLALVSQLEFGNDVFCRSGATHGVDIRGSMHVTVATTLLERVAMTRTMQDLPVHPVYVIGTVMALLEVRSGSCVSGLLRSLVSTSHEKVVVEQQYRMCRR